MLYFNLLSSFVVQLNTSVSPYLVALRVVTVKVYFLSGSKEETVVLAALPVLTSTCPL